MAFCGICGTQMEEHARFCPKCGAPANSGPVAPPAPASAPAAGQNTLMGVLSYLSILCLIPLFTAKDDPFVRFHTGQGLTLFLAEVLVSILSNILWRVLSYGLLWRAVGYLYGILGLFFSGAGHHRDRPCAPGLPKAPARIGGHRIAPLTRFRKEVPV